MTHQVKFCRVETEEEESFKPMVNLYISIFAEPPYNEKFDPKVVRAEFLNYIEKGMLLCAMIDGEVIGILGATKGMDHCDTNVITILSHSGISIYYDWYIADIAIAKNHRGKGIGKEMMTQIMSQLPSSNMFLRTSAHNNDKVIKFYKKLGFTVASVIENVKNVRTNGEVDFDERLYMYKLCTETKEDDGYKSGKEYFY